MAIRPIRPTPVSSDFSIHFCFGLPHCVILVAALFAFVGTALAQASDPLVTELAKEVADKGWLVYGARGDNGSWDLFVSRPDGSQRRNITNTPDFEEAAPRFSPDGRKLLYRRLKGGTAIDHDKWGFQGELVIADANGAHAAAMGGEGEFPWATWSPDGRQVVCLMPKGIKVHDLITKEMVREFPRQGIYQQLFWSPDGKWFCGVANNQGESWTVVRMDAASGEVNAVRKFQNCTPDWHPDSNHIILSSRPAGQTAADGYGYTQLWLVSGDGIEQRLLYGEDGSHIYGGAFSPDGRYVLLTKGPKDGSGAEKDGALICIIRASDTPMITGESLELRKLHPDTKNGPALELERAWEPHWTLHSFCEEGK